MIKLKFASLLKPEASIPNGVDGYPDYDQKLREQKAYFDISADEWLIDNPVDKTSPSFQQQFIRLGDNQTGSGRGRVLQNFTV
jgi:hypothetical protein